MTPAEALAYNQGVADVLAIIAQAADGIAASTKRSQLFREIATAGFHQIAADGRALLLTEQTDAPSITVPRV